MSKIVGPFTANDYNYRHGAECRIRPKAPRPMLQMTLGAHAGNLSLSKRSAEYYHRTPAPPYLDTNRITRKSMNPVPCFYSLPPEVRLEVYRLLLLTSHIKYRLCTTCKSLVLDKGGRVAKHWLYPVILECSRLINSEAMPVLYGENIFDPVLCPWWSYNGRYYPQSWQLSPKAIEYVSRIQTFRRMESYPHPFLELCADFSGLRQVEIHIELDIEPWETFLKTIHNKITHIESLTVWLWVPRDSYSVISHFICTDEMYVHVYGDVLEKHGMFPDHRRTLEYRPIQPSCESEEREATLGEVLSEPDDDEREKGVLHFSLVKKGREHRAGYPPFRKFSYWSHPDGESDNEDTERDSMWDTETEEEESEEEDEE